MTVGLIMAGGNATRMGPLSAQLSKSLLSIGQRPHLAHQAELLRRNGCKTIYVVVSPGMKTQVERVIRRANLDIFVIVQKAANGPAGALHAAREHLAASPGEVIVLMADTFLRADLVLPDGEWIGVAPPLQLNRSYCFKNPQDHYVDEVVYDRKLPVTVGAYRFNIERINDVAARIMGRWREGEIGMASILNGMRDVRHYGLATEWQDIGDVQSLAAAKRSMFISRETNRLELKPNGTITKHGDVGAQARWLERIHATGDPAMRTLVPQLYDWDDSHYTMEYVDLPTLSELWLYWPGSISAWSGITQGIIDRLETDLWERHSMEDSHILEHHMFVGKAISRLDDQHRYLKPMLYAVDELFDGSDVVFAHGDLNWNNILFSVNSSNFKLIDPRGDTVLPITYEYAKLGYSWRGFSAVTHGLDVSDRIGEMNALDEVLLQYISEDKLMAAEACLFIAGAILHNDEQKERMYQIGESMLRKVLDR